MKEGMGRRLWMTLAGGIGALSIFMGGGIAQAAPPNPSWTCSAHAAIVNVGGASGLTLDPLHANPDPNAPCTDDGATVPTVAAKDILGPNSVSVGSGNAQAQTGITNGAAPTWLQAPAAVAQISNTDVKLGQADTATPVFHLQVQAIRSYVYGQCINGQPTLASPPGLEGGEVVGLRINGVQIPATNQPDQTLTQLFEGLSPLAPLIRVVLNKQYSSTDAAGNKVLTREAVRIELLTAPNAAPLITIVLGAATVDSEGLVCQAPPGITPPGSGGVPPILPPTFPPGGNEPGSQGGLFTGVTGTGASAANGTNASECARLKLFYDLQRGTRGRPATHGPTHLTAHFGIRHVIRGYVRNCKGQPIVNAKIERIDILHNGRHLVKTGMRSRGRGKLTMIIPLNTTTRTIEFQYRAFINDPKIAAVRHLRIKVLNRHGKVLY
jgi:hypothetical protein